MSHFKLKLGLSLIPLFGFVIVLFWGMFSAYAINRKRTNAFICALLSMAGCLLVGIPLMIGIYLVVYFITPANTALFIGLILLIAILCLYAMAGICLAVQYNYCKKLTARQNTEYLS